MSRRRKRFTPAPTPPQATATVAPTRSDRWADLFAIDARSLAAFRIGLGLWLLVDLVWRSFDLTAHYTDAGILPRISRIGLYDLPGSDRKYWLSLFQITGDPWLVRGMFAAAAAAYLALAVGYRTRLAAVASYVFVCSLQSRLTPVCDGGDGLIRVLLFWGLFLPLGGRFSWDVAVGGRPPAPDRVCSFATFALLFQVGSLYVFGAAAKSDPVWHTDHTALYYALSVDAFATPFGRWLAVQHGLTRPLTFLVYWLEWLGPLVLLIPYRTAWLRLGVVAAFWGFHLGTAATFNLGLFPLAGCLAWVPFLPARVWGRWRWAAANPVGGAVRLGWVTTVVVAAVWAYVLVWNLREANPWWLRVLPIEASVVGRLLRVDQDWAMFAPKPLTEDGWYMMQGTLADGRVVNLWEPAAPLPFDKPADVADTYVNTRWRKYLLNLNTREYESHRVDFASFLARRWADDHPGGPPVVRCELVFMREPTPPPGEPVPAAERIVIFIGQDRKPDAAE